jgi:hypothetical protein
MTENDVAEIFMRLKNIEDRDARQDTDIEVLKAVIQKDIETIKIALVQLTSGRAEGCLKHASEIEAMKLAQANIQKEMGSLASARSVNALWVVVSSIGLSLLAAVIKSIFNL